MSIFAEYLFASGAAVGNPGSPKATVKDVTAQPLSPSPSLPGWSNLTEAVTLHPGSSIAIPSMKVSLDSFAVEIALAPAAAAATQTVFAGSAFPLIVELHPVKGGFEVRARLTLATGKLQIAAPQPLLKGQMTAVAVTYTGDDLTIAVDGEVVLRRCLLAATVAGAGTGPFVIGKTLAATLAGIRLGSDIPASVAASLEAARLQGMGEIESMWLRSGGDSGWVGKATGSEQKIGSGRCRRYANALLCWSPLTGAREVHGAILEKYESLKGPAGSFGYPVTHEDATPGVEGGRWSRFQAGAIAWSKSTGVHEVHGAILRHWLDLGGPAGVMGLPTSDELEDANGGRRSEFEGGTIHYSSRTGARAVWGAIKARYDSLGAAGGLLGYPVTDEAEVRDGASKPFGRVSAFQHGVVYWSSATGAHEVHGAIFDLYRRQGGPNSALGLPTSDEKAYPTGVRMSEFQHGVIGWTPALGARVVDRLDCVLSSATAPRIDDAGANKDAELFAFATVKINGEPASGWNRRRAPASGHVTKEVQFDHKPIPIGPVRLKTKIELAFEARDWDKNTSDDRLGQVTDTWGADTMWGLTHNGGVHDSVGIGGHGKVHYTYRITNPWKIDTNLPFRAQQWWNFKNFKTPTISWDQATEAFSDLSAHGNWLDAVANPIDTIFYKAVLKGIASKGNCHGMAVQAAIARLHGCPFPEPLVQFCDNTDPVIRRWINRRHMAQAGASSIGHVMWALTEPKRLLPGEVFARVRASTAAGRCCLLSMVNLPQGTGHTVLAYDCDPGSPNVIFVADPNVPWSQTSNVNVSRVEIDGERFQFFDAGGASDRYRSTTTKFLGVTLPGAFILEQPESVATAPVVTPFSTILSGLAKALGGLLVLMGDIAATQVSSGGATLLDPSPAPGRSRIRPNGMPGMTIVPLCDVDDPPFIVAQQGQLPDRLTVDWQGRANGPGSVMARSADLDVRIDLKNAGGAGARGSIALRRVHSGRPQAAIRGRAGLTADVSMGVLGDRRGQLDRHFALSLPLRPDAPAEFGPSDSGSGVSVSVPGGAPAVKITSAIRRADGKVQRGVINAGPLSAGEEIVCRPVDTASPLGATIIERRGSGRFVLDRRLVDPVPI
jgi:hypothetical protein